MPVGVLAGSSQVRVMIVMIVMIESSQSLGPVMMRLIGGDSSRYPGINSVSLSRIINLCWLHI